MLWAPQKTRRATHRFIMSKPWALQTISKNKLIPGRSMVKKKGCLVPRGHLLSIHALLARPESRRGGILV